VFCASRYSSPYPATVVTITDWIATNLAKSLKAITIKGYINALRSYHIENGFTDTAFTDPRIDLIIRGGKRVYGEGERRARQPLTEDILLKILPHIPDVYDGINIRAALCTGFAAFLRSGEFTWDTWNPAVSSKRQLARKHIQFNRDGSATLTLPSSKTDPFAQGVKIHLAASPTSPLCPVTALHLLIMRYPTSPDSPLFSRTFGPFSKPFFIDKVREYLLRAGIPTRGFSGHSLRKGAAVSAIKKGISRDEIKHLGCWKSDAVDIYINDLPEATLAANVSRRRFGLDNFGWVLDETLSN